MAIDTEPPSSTRRRLRINAARIEDSVFEIPLQLAEALETQRASLQHTLLASQIRLRTFARAHNWQAYTQEPFAHLCRVHADKASFDHDLLSTCGLDPNIELPSTYCAALEQGVLMSVSPQLYRTLYPEGDEEDAFEKLLTHEMAHRLHIRILHGNEDGMGDVWFYEGFALYAASQFDKTAPGLDLAEIWQIVNDHERGSYRSYAAVFQYFVKKVPIQQLVEHAAEDGFLDWLERMSR
jgi:hypothetical protein